MAHSNKINTAVMLWGSASSPFYDPISGAKPMSAYGTKQTKFFGTRMSATDPKRTLFALTASTPQDFDTVFYPGGHGPMWDLAEDPNSIKLIEGFLAADKPVALVCHAPGALRHVKTPEGKPLVEGKNVTGFTNTEEEAVGLTQVVPFLVEDELKAEGAHFSKTGDWGVHVVTDGLLITGQNPASSGPAAKELLDLLAKKV